MSDSKAIVEGAIQVPNVRLRSAAEADDGGRSTKVHLHLEPSGELVLQRETSDDSPCTSPILTCTVSRKTMLRTGRRLFMLSQPRPSPDDGFDLYCIEVPKVSDAESLDAAMDHLISQAKTCDELRTNVFDAKTDKGSADLYFYYYGMFQHQQNMLQDTIRTGTYYYAMLENSSDFSGKVVMDVGAGSSILSQFAAQAGARKVYAVEASPMADWAAKLCRENPLAANVVEVIKGKVEVISTDEKADVLVSEPMGTLLVNERMLESYIFARDHFLKPGGKMFPTLGRIHIAAFSDPALHAELGAKSAFWASPNFYGVDLTPLYQPAAASFYNQVVVDAFDPSVLVSESYTHVIDFRSITEEELAEIRMPFNLQVGVDCTVHGIATWFDVLFDGSTSKHWLTTAPGQPTTHWFQLRCAMQTPIHLRAKHHLSGDLVLKAHSRQSYDIHITLQAPPYNDGGPRQEGSAVLDLKDPYYRQMMSAAWTSAPQAEVQHPPPPPPPAPRQSTNGYSAGTAQNDAQQHHGFQGHAPRGWQSVATEY